MWSPPIVVVVVLSILSLLTTSCTAEDFPPTPSVPTPYLVTTTPETFTTFLCQPGGTCGFIEPVFQSLRIDDGNIQRNADETVVFSADEGTTAFLTLGGCTGGSQPSDCIVTCVFCACEFRPGDTVAEECTIAEDMPVPVPTPTSLPPTPLPPTTAPPTPVGIPTQLTERFEKSYDVGRKGTRTVIVYYTTDSTNSADEVNSQADAEMVADWIGAAWIALRNYNDPLNGRTEFVVALYEVTTITTCCGNDLLSLDAGTVLSNPELARERSVYEFWKSINYSTTHGRWVNEGFATYGTYQALSNDIELGTTFGYKEALDFFFAGEYQISLIEQEGTAAVFWQYTDDQTQFFASAVDSFFADVWRDGLSEQNIFEKVDRRLDFSFNTLFANFGAACYVHNLSIDSLTSVSRRTRNALTFPDADTVTGLYSGYPNLVPNYDYTSTDINTGIDTIVEMPSWSNSYFRLNVGDDERRRRLIIGDTTTDSIQISIIQDVTFPVTYTLLLIRDTELVGFIRVVDETNFVRTVFNDNYSEIVLVVTSLGEALGFSFQVGTGSPVLSIQSPLSLTAVGSPTSPRLLTVQFRFSDTDGVKEVAGLNPEDVSILIGTVVVPQDDVISFEYLVGGYLMVIRAPQQDLSISGTAVDLRVTVGSLTDTKIGVLLYEDTFNTDTIIVIDRSVSMNQSGKLIAAQIASSVLIDSFSGSDRVGIITYNDMATVDLALGPVSSNREALLQAIDNINPSGDEAFIGSALLAALAEFDANGVPSQPHSIVLISDGRSPATDTGIDAFLTEWDERSLLQCNSNTNAGCRPVVHTVFLGDRQVERSDLELLSARTGGVYHFVEVPVGLRRDLISKHSEGRQLETTEELLSVQLASILRTVNEDILSTERLLSETGSLPCSSTGGEGVTVTFNIDGSISNFAVFFVWTGELLEPEAQLLRPINLNAGQPAISAANYYVWDISSIETGIWSISIPASNAFCSSTNSFLVEVAATSSILFETGLSFEGDTPEVGEPVEVFATLLTDQPLAFQSVQATIVDPDGLTLTLELEDSRNGVYANVVFASKSGNYDVTVTASGSEINLGFGDYDRKDSASFGVPIPADSDGDGIPDAIERRYKCLDIAEDDAQDDADDDGVSNVREIERNLDPCNSDSDNSGEADGSEIVTGQDPKNPDDDSVTCSSDVSADNKAFDRDGTGVCASAGFAILRYSPDRDYAFINVWRAEIAQGASSSTLRTRDFTLLNNVRGASQFTDVDGEFIDTEIERGKRYCYRIQGVLANGKKSCIKGLVRPACTVPLGESLCVKSFKINRGACCTDSAEVLLSVDATGVQRMKVSNSPSFENIEWEPFETDRAWILNDTTIGTRQTVYTTLEGNDGSTSSRAASITVLEFPPSLSPTEAPIENPYQCRQLFINGETLHINFGLFCIALCLPFPSVFRFLGWGRGECPSCGLFCI